MGNPHIGDDNLEESARCFGLDISEIYQVQTETPGDDACEVWPEHWQALHLYLVCWGQCEVLMGPMGDVHYLPARSINVRQELAWLDIALDLHAPTVALYREIEREALNLVNARSVSSA